jgi:hypothetical protein
MMAFSVEVSAQILQWRAQAADGTLTLDQMKEAIKVLRQDRVSSHIASTTSRTKKAESKAPVDTDALLKELGL